MKRIQGRSAWLGSVVLVCLATASCSKAPEDAAVRAGDEQAILTTSTFFKGETVPMTPSNQASVVQLFRGVAGSDGGVIGPPSSGGGKSDGGSIPAPTPKGTPVVSNPPPTTPPVVPPVTPPSTGGGTTTTPPVTGGGTTTTPPVAGGGTTTTPPATGGNDGGAVTPPPAPGGSDGGTIAGGGDPKGNDGGTVTPPTTPPTTGGGTTTPPATNPPTTNPPVAGGGDTNTPPPVTPPVVEPPVVQPPVTNPPPGGNDGGTVAGNNPPPGGNDGGTVNPPTTPPGGNDGGTTPPTTQPPVTPPIAGGGNPTTPPVTPPVVEPPVTNPPVIPPVVPPVTPPVAGGGNDGGNVPPGGDPKGNDGGEIGDGDCPEHHDGGCRNPKRCKRCPRKRYVDVTLPRMCTWHGISGKFFEQAKHPILSLETTYQRPKSAAEAQRQLAMPSVIDFLMRALSSVTASKERKKLEAELKAAKKPIQMASAQLSFVMRDLSDQNVMEATPFSKSFRIDQQLATLKSEIPSTWGKAVVRGLVCDDTTGTGKCGDKPTGQQIAVKALEFTVEKFPAGLDLDIFSKYISYNSKYYSNLPDWCEKLKSPLVLDLAHDGISLSSPTDGVWFDLDDSGRTTPTGWTLGKDDAFLVRDLDRDGWISSGAELFGSATKLASGERAANGFEALKDLDDNHDGLFSNLDRAYSEVRLWIDRNHNGWSEAKELFTLERAGVESINLGYIDMMEVDPHGNQTRQRSTFRHAMQGGATKAGLIVDVWFQTMTRY